MKKYYIINIRGECVNIQVGISNRHVHLSEDIKTKLFGENYILKKIRDLKQPGEFVADEKITIKTDAGVIENVRVVGPLRDYTQVEILKSDALKLEINPPTRNSGDLNNSESLTLCGPLGEVKVSNCCIVAGRHIHMTKQDALNFGVTNNEIVKIQKGSIIIEEVHIKINDNYLLECHLDKDDETKYNIHTNDEVNIIIS